MEAVQTARSDQMKGMQRMPLLLYCGNSIPVLGIKKTLTTMAMMDFRPMWIDVKYDTISYKKMLEMIKHINKFPGYFLLKGLATKLFKDSVSPNCSGLYSPTLPIAQQQSVLETGQWAERRCLTVEYSHGLSLHSTSLPPTSALFPLERVSKSSIKGKDSQAYMLMHFCNPKTWEVE